MTPDFTSECMGTCHIGRIGSPLVQMLCKRGEPDAEIDVVESEPYEHEHDRDDRRQRADPDRPADEVQMDAG
jgi:hypothetical protein